MVLSKVAGKEIRGTVIYADDALDITDQVIELLNKGETDGD